MAITPADIQAQTFSEAKRGYDPAEVDVFLETLSSEVDAMLAKIVDLKGRLTATEQQLADTQAQLVQAQDALGSLVAGADAEIDVAAAGIDAGHGSGEDLMLLGAPLVVDHAVLSLPQALNDDLLAVTGGNAAELHILHREAHHTAQFILGRDASGLLQRDLGAGVLHLLHDLLLHEHLQVTLLLVDLHHHVLHTCLLYTSPSPRD